MLTERQQQIINSSLDLISEKGIQGLTIKNLAGKIGVTEAAIYRHYENKIQILIHILDSFEVGTKNVYERVTLPAIERIEHIFKAHFKMFSENPALAAVVFSESLFRNEEVLKHKVRDIINYNNNVVTRILEEGQQSGNIRHDLPAENLAIMIMGSLRLLVKRWELNNYSFNLIDEGTKQLESLKIMITKD